ncbi:hypothetical protein [Paracoccus aestuarii]|nr:hypothetical protein [Paracoccus aestuarii]WCR00555.1 hypothetical protein JHW48_07900 [Paracoccus aestuarii]
MIRGLALALVLAAPAGAEGVMPSVVAPPVAGSVSRDDGLAAWDRAWQVMSHPRCANCHVGDDHRPMWSGPDYPRTTPHGMNISAGDSRMGIETLPCATCHITASTLESDPRQAPNAMVDWHLPPVEMAWFGLTSGQVCRQLRDPAMNGGRDWVQIAEHLQEDASHGGFVAWGFAPGGGREPAPFGLQAHIDDVLRWGAAEQPCPE